MPLFNDVPTQIITSASVPTNLTQGLIWNELDSSGGLIETWSYTNSSWRSNLKNLHAGLFSITGGAQNVRSEFSFNPDYNIFIKKWTVSLISAVAISSSNYLSFYFLKNLATIKSELQFTINSLAVGASYTNQVDVNQLFTFTSGNSSCFEFRVYVNNSPVSFFASSNFSYRLVRR